MARKYDFVLFDFDGTIAEWNAIEKEEGWDSNNDNYIIYCTDGEINK